MAEDLNQKIRGLSGTTGYTGPKGGLKVAMIALVLVLGAAAVFLGTGIMDGMFSRPELQDKHALIFIKGKKFTLDLALDDETRFHGLSGRTNLPADGGMLFAFRRAEPRAFVMRDCPEAIDILYLDGSGRVVSAMTMPPEAPRTEAEKPLGPPFSGAPKWAWVNPGYENRLTHHSSRYATQFVIELRGGRIKELGIQVGDDIPFDWRALEQRAK